MPVEPEEIRLTGGGTVVVRVLTPDGEPRVGSMVILQRNMPFSQMLGTSDEKGEVLFEHVPAGSYMAMEMNIGTGNVAVRGFDRNLEIDVGVGDVEATLPKSAVKVLEMDTGIGNIYLHLGDQTLRGAGMVGSHLDWSQGQGHAEIEVDCGVGDIDITLR